MKETIIRKSIMIAALAIILLLLTQCDLILGSGGNANVGIDLGVFYGDAGRAITGVPSGISITGFKVSVFGPGMNRIEKTLSVGTRYVNMSVPAGKDRYFTVEAFIRIDLPDIYHYSHIKSYKGRAIADLRPGKYVGLPFNMVAGATQLLAPDRGLDRIWWANDLASFSSTNYGTMTVTGGFAPIDIDIAADGRVAAAQYGTAPSVRIGDNIQGSSLTLAGPSAATQALAMDRDCLINIDHDGSGSMETNIVYFADSTTLWFSGLAVANGTLSTTPHQMQFPTSPSYQIRGMDVDPWTHRLYIAAYYQVSDLIRIPYIIEYDPFYYDAAATPPYGRVVQAVPYATLGSFQDVIVKDNRIFVLYNVRVLTDDLTTPIILVYDKGLNFIRGYGNTSADGTDFIESTAPGQFYKPKKFIAHENHGLYILDDSDLAFDKIVYIDEDLDPGSWRTFPASGADFFSFIDVWP